MAGISISVWDRFIDNLILLFLSLLECVHRINFIILVLVLCEPSFLWSQSAEHTLLVMSLNHSLAFNEHLGSFISWFRVIDLNYHLWLLMCSIGNSLIDMCHLNLLKFLFKNEWHLINRLRWVNSLHGCVRSIY